MAQQLSLFDMTSRAQVGPAATDVDGKATQDVRAYITAVREALRANPPCLWPAYAVDTVGTWRYVFRSIGHGLADYSDEVVREVIGSLYGLVPMVHFLTSIRMPPVDARHVTTWVLEARAEVLAEAKGPGFLLVHAPADTDLPLAPGASILAQRGGFAVVFVPEGMVQQQKAALGRRLVTSRVYLDRETVLDGLAALAGQ